MQVNLCQSVLRDSVCRGLDRYRHQGKPHLRQPAVSTAPDSMPFRQRCKTSTGSLQGCELARMAPPGGCCCA